MEIPVLSEIAPVAPPASAPVPLSVPAFGVFSRISPLVAFVELPLEITTLPPKPGGDALVAAVDLPAVMVT